MKIFDIFIHAAVLWTLVECRNVGRLGRSLDVEGKGSNLTQKQPPREIHSDGLQHFTTIPPSAPESDSQHSTPSLIKDLPFLPEDIQTLKNDDHLRITYDRKITVDKENQDADSSQEQNKTQKSNTNDVMYIKYNRTGTSSATASEVSISHSSYEHSSTSIVYDDDNSEEKTHSYVMSSTTETSKVISEWKNLEAKKKEKGKKEILDSATVPTDSVGGVKIEKPYKDSLLNSKLKEKNKDSISEALDDRRSTSRISNSSSVSLSDHDNKLLNMELLKVNPPNSNNKDAVNQSVNSVINVNGVNNDSLKKSKTKVSLKRVVEDSSNTEADTAVSSAQVVEDTVLNHEIPTPPSPVSSSSVPAEKSNYKQYSPLRQSQLNEAIPTKVDILPKMTISSSTTVIKPSIAFKQQLANKLKGLEPLPTAPMTPDEVEEVQTKSGSKSSSKTLRKKPKLELSSVPEMNIPSTATAWTLASLKSSTETLKSSLESQSSSSSETPSSDATSTPRLSTLPPVTRVKSFVPWSTRLLRSSSTKSPSTTPVDFGDIVPSFSSESTPPDVNVNSTLPSPKTSDSSKAEQSPTTEEQSVIRTTLELERNNSETSINIIQPITEDVMVKDQSSPIPQHTFSAEVKGVATEISNSSNLHETRKDMPINRPSNENESQVVENVIETQNLQVANESEDKEENKNVEKLEESLPNNTNVIGNQIPQDTANENIDEVKSSKDGEKKEHKNIVLDLKTSPVLDDVANTKAKNVSDHIDPGAGDLAGDTPGEEGKSGEDSDEEERLNLTTTLPPIFEHIETTTVIDLDEDVDENDREEEDFPVFVNKTSQVPAVTPSIPSENNTTPSSNIPRPLNINGTGTYITSIDIVPKENTTHVVTKKPSEGDINWYSVDGKQNNESVEETSEKPTPAEATTTVAFETTIEPETTTKATENITTTPTVDSDTATTMTPSTTTTATQPQTEIVNVEGDADIDREPDIVSMDDPSSCVRVVVHMSPARLCHGQQQLRENIAAQLSPHIASWDQVLILKPQECNAEILSEGKQDLSVDVCFAGRDQLLSPAIRNEFLRRFTPTTDPNFPIINVQMIMDTPMGPDGFDNVLAAIILSVIAAICLFLLGILLVIVRKRQGRFNYGQRCTPVSLDDYSLDNISVYNSVRRKGALRASKRSYGNPGFDDPGAPSHPINFAGLANFSNDREALNEEFNQIPMITVKPDELPPGAESKNRYANVIPLPETRVVLQTKASAHPLDEYINANYIKSPKGQEKVYIACQAPLQSTIEDFWKMVWQQQTKVILMLTALSENGVEKCADYLPQLEITDCHRMFGDFQVTLKKHEVREKYIISSLQLKNLETNLWREVTHLWYMSWPAQGVPEDCSSMIAFLIEARSYMRGAQGPTVVHCSPGTGRTGTVIAIDLCIRDFETQRSVDIPKTVYALRRDRAGSVQTKDQYAFIYQVLNLYATKLTGGALDSI